jgi:hypothetical protein
MLLRRKSLILLISSLFLIPTAKAYEPCQKVLCLSNTPGLVPPVCRMIRQEYFNTRIYSPYYNPPATAKERELVHLVGCIGARPQDISAITMKYGMIFTDPGT